MGHRALVAYERPSSGYTVRYSHWGARGYRLLESVTATTPLGRVDRAGDGGGTTTAVRPEPLGVATDVADVAASFVDPVLHEAVFVVDASYRVRAFEPLAFWGDSPSAVHGGALVELRLDRDPGRDARELRAWRRGATAVLHDPELANGRGETDTPTPHETLFDALTAEVHDRAIHPIPPDQDGVDQHGEVER